MLTTQQHLSTVATPYFCGFIQHNYINSLHKSCQLSLSDSCSHYPLDKTTPSTIFLIPANFTHTPQSWFKKMMPSLSSSLFSSSSQSSQHGASTDSLRPREAAAAAAAVGAGAGAAAIVQRTISTRPSFNSPKISSLPQNGAASRRHEIATHQSSRKSSIGHLHSVYTLAGVVRNIGDIWEMERIQMYI